MAAAARPFIVPVTDSLASATILGSLKLGGGDDDGAGPGDGFGAFFGVAMRADVLRGAEAYGCVVLGPEFDVERGGALLHEDAGAYEDGLGA